MKHILTTLAMLAMLLTGDLALAASKGGWYAGGHGSSHKGGHYVNPRTGNHYQKRQ